MEFWIQYASVLAAPVATVFAALLVAFFSYRTWRVTKAKLNLDLFDKRYELYRALEDDFWANPMDELHTNDFELMTRTSFLFGEELSELMSNLRTEMLTIQHAFQQGEPHTENLSLAVEIHRVKDVAHMRFLRIARPYLDFSNWYS